MPDTLIVCAWYYVMWEELSVKPFQKSSNYWKPILKCYKGNRALWLLFSIQSSHYGAPTVAKVSLYSAYTGSTVSFGNRLMYSCETNLMKLVHKLTFCIVPLCVSVVITTCFRCVL